MSTSSSTSGGTNADGSTSVTVDGAVRGTGLASGAAGASGGAAPPAAARAGKRTADGKCKADGPPPEEELTVVVHAYLRDKKKAQFRTGRDAQWQTAGTHAKAWKTQLADDGVTWVVETNFFATKPTWCDGFADGHPVGTRSVFLGRDASTSSRDLLRLLRLAQARPQLVLRIASAAIIASTTGRPDELIAAVNESELGWGTTVEELRAEYGERQRWWGDLTPSETRALYHALLPTSLLEMGSAAADAPYTQQERAELAIAARKAAKQYARERTLLPFAVGCALLDGLRQLLKGGSFRSSGLSEEQIWQKYAGCLPSDLPDGAAFDDDVYMTILRKACSTNRYVDMVCGASTWSVDVSEAAQAASERL